MTTSSAATTTRMRCALDVVTRAGLTVKDIDRPRSRSRATASAEGWFLQVFHGPPQRRGDRVEARQPVAGGRPPHGPAARMTRDHRTRDIVPVWLRARGGRLPLRLRRRRRRQLFDRNTQSFGYVPGPEITGSRGHRRRQALRPPEHANGEKARARWRCRRSTSSRRRRCRPAARAADPSPSPPRPPPPPPGQARSRDHCLRRFERHRDESGRGDRGGLHHRGVTRRHDDRGCGLAAGKSATYSWTPSGCVQYTATADSSNAVAESNESNNTAQWAPSIC